MLRARRVVGLALMQSFLSPRSKPLEEIVFALEIPQHLMLRARRVVGLALMQSFLSLRSKPLEEIVFA
jgi:hypothetical protein